MNGGTKGALVVIPARYGSTRLPAKALLRETGKYLVQHVWERAVQARRIDRVVVATDDERIRDAVRSFGGDVEMTSPDHPNGTSRVAEVAARLKHPKIINVQGDEPELDPALIDKVVELLDEEEMATIATPSDDLEGPARVKVVVDHRSNAIYFSRAMLAGAYLHLGIYGYSDQFLARYVKLAPSPLEAAERLEQLRALYYGYKIRVGIMKTTAAGGIDTPEDYAAFVRRTGTGPSTGNRAI
ncbi:MAG: 3-deoxy-manno-octulosonate cytidylyltransferase [Planctomycetes bacterium]|nr:3-deoxy-manno-octulosonate cytidylyltransferase [Planctomycetota bacterium]